MARNGCKTVLPDRRREVKLSDLRSEENSVQLSLQLASGKAEWTAR